MSHPLTASDRRVPAFGDRGEGLLLARDTELTRLSIGRRQPSNWELEPLHFLGASLILGMRHLGERAERSSGKPSKVIRWGNRLSGFTG